MSRGISSRSNLAACHAMLVSIDGRSKSRHHQLLQSLHVNFCRPMVYSNKLAGHGSNHIVILLDFLHPPVTCHLLPITMLALGRAMQGDHHLTFFLKLQETELEVMFHWD